LPDTYSEMAVPIILGDQVVGVLDVQEDEIGGLDEGDASLLRSLANQVAVAIRNARQFEEVQTALAEAQAVQARYMQRSWAAIERAGQSVEYHYQQLGAAPLSEAVASQLERGVTGQNEPTVITIKADREAQDPGSQSQSGVVAPIRVQNQTIGAIQLQDTGRSGSRQWNEQELTLVQVVAEQVAQVAENIRLFEETRERAGRERLIGQVTDRMRRAPDLETLMKIGVEELSRALGPARTFVRLGSEAELGTGEVVGLAEDFNGQDAEMGHTYEAIGPSDVNGVFDSK
jgi:GAF domain-containing protein